MLPSDCLVDWQNHAELLFPCPPPLVISWTAHMYLQPLVTPTMKSGRRPSIKSVARSAAAEPVEADAPPLLTLPCKARGPHADPPTPGKGPPQANTPSDLASLGRTLGRTSTVMGPDFLKQTLGRTATAMEPDFFKQTMGRTPTGARTDLMRQMLGRAETSSMPDFLRQTLACTGSNMGSGFFGRTLGRAATGKNSDSAHDARGNQTQVKHPR